MKYTEMKDHEDEKGNLNWESYRRAQRNNGESCFRCDAYIPLSTGHLSQCRACKNLTTDMKKVWHKSLVRCPSCKHIQQPYEYGPGERAVANEEDDLICEECNHEYRIGILTSVEYQSPELEPEIDTGEGTEDE